jgi:hypothetical protein
MADVRMSISEAASKWRMSYSNVRRLVLQGRILTEEFNNQYVILQAKPPEKLPRGALTKKQRAAWPSSGSSR